MKYCLLLIAKSFFRSHNSKNISPKILAVTLLSAFLSLLQVRAYAQNKTITGHVADSTAKNIAGVTVSADKSKKITLTDNDGNFSITVTPNDKNLVFSFVGMKSVTQGIGTESYFDVVLKPDVSG